MILLTTISFLLTAVLLPFARRKAVGIGFLDQPEGRKKHCEPVPPIGGLVVVPVFFVIVLLSGLSIFEHGFFLAALLTVFILGALDDLYHVSATKKFFVHLFAASLLVIGNHTTIWYLGDLFGFGEIWTEPIAIGFTVLCVVFLINAINMIDGLDGLCGGIMMIMLMALSTAALVSGGHEMVMPILVLTGAIGGFMIYNYRHALRKKASLFMGDSGSTSMGLILAWAVIELSQDGANMGAGLLQPALIAWVLSIPVFDTLALFVYRLSQKRSPFSADRRHAHYLICDQGISIENSVNVMHGLTLFYCAIGVVAFGLFHLAPVFLMPFWAVSFVIHFAMTFGGAQWLLRKVLNSY